MARRVLGPRPRRWRLALGSALGLLALLALAPRLWSAFTWQQPAPGGRIVEGVVGQPRSLNPLRLRNGVDHDLAGLLFNGLTRLSPTGEPQPDLANWTADPDGRGYTFTLRPDLLWHDGKPVTSADAVFTLETLQRLDAAEAGAAGRDAADSTPLDGLTFEAATPLQVRVTATSARPEIPRLVARPLAPAHRLAGLSPAELDSAPDAVRPVGTGPFRVVDAALDRLTLARWAPYHAGRPYLDAYVVRFYPDADAARAAFGRGEIDALWTRAAPDDAGAGRSFAVPVWDSLTVLQFNTAGTLADRALRRALALALDPGTLAPAALPERVLAARGPLIPPQAPGGLSLTGDTSAALDRLGWSLGADGIRRRGQAALKLEVLTPDGAESAALAGQVVERLRRAGVDASIAPMPWARLLGERLATGRFDAAVVSLRGVGWDANLTRFWGSGSAAAGLNVGAWRSAAADAAIAAIAAARSPTDLAAARAAFLAAWTDEMPAVPLAWPRYRFLAPADLQGLTLGPLLEPAQRYRDVQDWYLKTATALRNPLTR